MRNRQSEEEIEEELKRNGLERIKANVKTYAIAALPGLLTSLDITTRDSQFEVNIAKRAFSIGVAMAEREQELFNSVESLMSQKYT